MPEFGWKKEIEYDWIEVTREGKILRIRYKVAAQSHPCSVCKSNENTWVHFYPSGIFWSCTQCKRAMGIGNEDAQKLGTIEVTLVEAVLTLDRTEQALPAYFREPKRISEARRLIAKGQTK